MDPSQQPQLSQQPSPPSPEPVQSVPPTQEQLPAQVPNSAPAAVGAENPGQVMGIISLVLGFIGFGLFGLIVGIIGLKKSKKVGMSNGFALAGIIVSAISLVLVTLLIVGAVIGGSKLISKCQELGPGTHSVDGVTYTCS